MLQDNDEKLLPGSKELFRFQILLVGDDRGMEEISALLLALGQPTLQFRRLEDAQPAVETADLTVIFQQTPDDAPEQLINQTLALNPLMRIVVCQGPWCASYGRTRQHWPAAVCVDETRWESRVQAELKVMTGELTPLPWTAGLDEIFAFDQRASDLKH